MKALVLAALSGAMIASVPADAAILVNFSFIGTIDGPGTVVNGQLAFANAGTDVAATRVTILSSTDPLLNNMFDFIPDGFVNSNSFTVSQLGIVSAADLFVEASPNSTYRALTLGGTNRYEIDFGNGSFAIAVNNGGFAGVTFSPAIAAVPEPATWAMMIGGFGGIGGILRQRRKANVKVSFA